MRSGKLLALADPEELKRLLPGKVWAVTAEPLLDAVELLERQDFVHNAALASDHLRVITVLGVTAAQITGCLTAGGVHTHLVTEGAATIEDVFMALSSRSL
jgi:hypothetical protein